MNSIFDLVSDPLWHNAVWYVVQKQGQFAKDWYVVFKF